MVVHPAVRSSANPFPIYLNGLHVENDVHRSMQMDDDYRSGRAFGAALSDLSWFFDLESTLARLIKAAPGYPEALYNLHLAEQIAFALCVEHPALSECLCHVAKVGDPLDLMEDVACIAKRMQRDEPPQGYRWARPCTPLGEPRPVSVLLRFRLVSLNDLIERAMQSVHAITLVPKLLGHVDAADQSAIRQRLVRELLLSSETLACEIREMLGLERTLGTWEASKRFHLMFELAARGLLEEHQLECDSLIAQPGRAIEHLMEVLACDRGYLNDLAQQDLSKVMQRMLLEASQYPVMAAEERCIEDPEHLTMAINFCLANVRGARDILINSLLVNFSQGELYCPAPWEPSATQRLKTLLAHCDATGATNNRVNSLVLAISKPILCQKS